MNFQWILAKIVIYQRIIIVNFLISYQVPIGFWILKDLKLVCLQNRSRCLLWAKIYKLKICQMMNSIRSLLTRETLTYLIKYLLLLPYPSHKHKLRLSLGFKIRKILIKKHFWFHWVKILVVLGLLILSMELSAFCLFVHYFAYVFLYVLGVIWEDMEGQIHKKIIYNMGIGTMMNNEQQGWDKSLSH